MWGISLKESAIIEWKYSAGESWSTVDGIVVYTYYEFCQVAMNG